MLTEFPCFADTFRVLRQWESRVAVDTNGLYFRAIRALICAIRVILPICVMLPPIRVDRIPNSRTVSNAITPCITCTNGRQNFFWQVPVGTAIMPAFGGLGRNLHTSVPALRSRFRPGDLRAWRRSSIDLARILICSQVSSGAVRQRSEQAATVPVQGREEPSRLGTAPSHKATPGATNHRSVRKRHFNPKDQPAVYP